MVIDDVRADPAWRTHPMPILYGFQGYASLPLYLPDGSFFGTLCAIDPAPHTVSSAEVMAALERCAAELTLLIGEAVPQLDQAAAQPRA